MRSGLQLNLTLLQLNHGLNQIGAIEIAEITQLECNKIGDCGAKPIAEGLKEHEFAAAES
jgi:hypothetical protein